MGHRYGVTGAGAGAAGAGLTSPLRMICATCCFSIFTALSCPLTVGLSGASACTLPLAVSWRLPSPLIGSDGQPQACRIFSGTPRPLKLRLTWRCGSWDTAAVACKMPRSVKALSSVILTVEAVAFSLSDGRRTSIRLKVAAAAFSVALPFHTPQLPFFTSCSSPP